MTDEVPSAGRTDVPSIIGSVESPPALYVKALTDAGLSPHQGKMWPLPTRNPDGSWTPGDWLVTSKASGGERPLTPARVDACVPAVYGCRPDQLPNWLNTCLFVLELDGAVEGQTKVAGTRGRLLRPIESWTPGIARAFAFGCADRAVRIHAVAALRAAGLTEQADGLAALAPIVDETTARAAWDAVGAAWEAAWAAGDAARAAGDAARAARAAGAAGAAEREWQVARLTELLPELAQVVA